MRRVISINEMNQLVLRAGITVGKKVDPNQTQFASDSNGDILIDFQQDGEPDLKLLRIKEGWRIQQKIVKSGCAEGDDGWVDQGSTLADINSDLKSYNNPCNRVEYLNLIPIPKNPVYFPLHFFGIFPLNNSYGLFRSELETKVDKINKTFEQTPFRFFLEGATNIFNDHLYQIPQLSLEAVVAHPTQGPISVVVRDRIDRYDQKEGIGTSLRGVVIDLDASAATTYAHELGHVFHLAHPHEQLDLEGTPEECLPRIETVDGKNAYCSGDYLTDTPADPGNAFYLNQASGCFIDGACQLVSCPQDPNGDIYHPAVNNIMSYYTPCMRDFTRQQIQKMICIEDRYDRLHSLRQTSPFSSQKSLITVGCDSKSLTTIQEAVTQVSVGGVVEVCEGTYHENIVLRGDLILRGRKGQNVTLDGSHHGSVIEIQGYETGKIKLENLVIKNGSSQIGGGIRISSNERGINRNPFPNKPTIHLQNVTLENNEAVLGGGLASDINHHLILDQVQITQNTLHASSSAPSMGGGIYLKPARGEITFEISDSAIVENKADVSGGLYLRRTNGHIQTTSISHNQARLYSGGMEADESMITLENTHFDSNQVSQPQAQAPEGGAAFTLIRGAITFNYGSISNNRHPQVGGSAIMLLGDDFKLTASHVDWDQAGDNRSFDIHYNDTQRNMTSAYYNGLSADEDLVCSTDKNSCSYP